MGPFDDENKFQDDEKSNKTEQIKKSLKTIIQYQKL